MPPRQDSNVVFPQPLGPSRITSDPAGTSRFKPLIGRSAYPPLEYSTTRSLNAQIAHRSGTSERERRIDRHRAPESGEAGQQTDHNRDRRQRQVGTGRHHDNHREQRCQQLRKDDAQHRREQRDDDRLQREPRQDRPRPARQSP